MYMTKQEQQSKKSHRNLNARQIVQRSIAQLKHALNACFKNMTSPGFVPENRAIFGSYLVISLVFILNLISDQPISFHLLYIFPVTFIAMHSSRTSWVTAAVALAISLQAYELLFFQSPIVENHVYLFLLAALSNIIFAFVTRYSRAHILEANRLSTIDPLTHIHNRRGFDMAMKTEAMQQRRKDERDRHFSLVLIDLDGFKGLNDTMGHKAGDEALILLCCVLRKLIRHTDTIYRIGGDEFVILMPNTEASDCHALCNLFCHTIRARLSEVFSYPVSASIGFTTSENPTEISVDMLSVADKALYRAEALGKGCVVRGNI